MSRIFDALRRAEALEAARTQRKSGCGIQVEERRRSERSSLATRVRIYGYGQGVTPFFVENSIRNASETGALLLMTTPVVAGQKLLLVNEAAGQVQECHVLRTSSRTAQEMEVAVAFPAAQPEFWNHLGEHTDESGREKRKRPRVALPRGMSITWRGRGQTCVSRVQTIGAGGLSIASPKPLAVDEVAYVSFEVPAGEVHAQTIVRHSHEGEGMGAEFVVMSDEAHARLQHLLKKLLG